MTTESAKNFIKRIQEDKEFAGKIEKITDQKERTAFIKMEGFDFTREELTDAASEMNAVDVAGGKCCAASCESESYCNCYRW